MITAGTFVPFIVGVSTVKAEVLGLCRDGEQYMLRLDYFGIDYTDGQEKHIRREFQRDRKFIEGQFQEYTRELGN